MASPPISTRPAFARAVPETNTSRPRRGNLTMDVPAMLSSARRRPDTTTQSPRRTAEILALSAKLDTATVCPATVSRDRSPEMALTGPATATATSTLAAARPLALS